MATYCEHSNASAEYALKEEESKDKGCTVLANVGPFVIRPSSVVCPVFISEKLSIVNILQVV